MTVAVLTGGAGEIGRALAARLIAEGAEVHLVDASPTVEDVAGALGAVGHRLDLTDDDGIGELAAIERADLLVNGVGSWPVTPLDDLTPATWRRLIDLNLNTAYAATWALRDALREAHGAVVTIGSAVGFKGHPDLAFYAAAKAGIVGMTRSLALALGPDGVRVNAVAPGLVATPAMREMWGPERESAFRNGRALDVSIETDDVVESVLFLASPVAARTITGQTLVVDGGTVLH